MGVDPWAESDEESDDRGGGGGGGGAGGSDGEDLEIAARHRRSLFWNEGYREGIEEGKGATVQLGFNRGFTDGAAAGLAYGQVRDTCKTAAAAAALRVACCRGQGRTPSCKFAHRYPHAHSPHPPPCSRALHGIPWLFAHRVSVHTSRILCTGARRGVLRGAILGAGAGVVGMAGGRGGVHHDVPGGRRVRHGPVRNCSPRHRHASSTLVY